MEFYNKKTGLKKDINFRQFNLEDASEIITCLYDAYEDTYVKPYLYSVEEIIRLYKSEELVFTIAEDVEAGVIGILGNQKSKHFQNQNEFVTQVIKKEYRGYGIAKAHINYNLSLLINKPFAAFFGHALGSHPISQLTFTQLGFTPCGFILSVFDQNVFLTGHKGGPNKKISQAVILKPQKTNKIPTLYINSEIAPIIEGNYQQLNIGYQVSTLGDDNLPQESIIQSENDSIHKTLSIFVSVCGEDFEMKMNALIDKYCKVTLQTINLFLNIENEGAIKGYEILRKLGFFFTGLQPSGEASEYLIMHHPLGLFTDITAIPFIEAYRDYVNFIEKEIANYVQK